MKRFDDTDVVHKRTQLIGANLRALRKAHGKTLEEVAQAGGLSVSHLANVEHGRRTLDGEQLRQILQLYGYSLAVFLTHIATFLDPQYENNDDYVSQYEPIPLVGRHGGEATLLLLHPTPTIDTAAHLLLLLPPGGELWHKYLVLPHRCSLAIAQGTLLVETPHREYVLTENEYLALAPGVAHRFRNHTPAEARAYIWVESACI